MTMSCSRRAAWSIAVGLPVLTQQMLVQDTTPAPKKVIEYASPKMVHTLRQSFSAVGMDAVSGYLESREELIGGLPEPTIDEAQTDQFIVDNLNRDGFLWGSATAAYQVEGAWDKGGREPSIWDKFSQTGHTWGSQTGNDATDFFYYWKSDIQRLKNTGFNAFRMSISWTRILSQGRDGKQYVNDEGVAFYKGVFAELIKQNITPIVTLYHWDLPTNMDWMDKGVIQSYVDYADFIFKTFPEITHWTTFNEPWTFCELGYKTGQHAPGIKDESGRSKFLCGHHVLLAHAYAVKVFRDYYKKEGSTINIVLNVAWGFPLSNNAGDVEASHHFIDDTLGWFADPIYLSGEYPGSMRERYGDKMPRFTGEEISLLRRSFEGPFGLNIYTAMYIKKDHWDDSGYSSSSKDLGGNDIGKTADSEWLQVVPQAAYEAAKVIHIRYRVPILVTENGCDEPGENSRISLKDEFRIKYYRQYLSFFAKAQAEGIPIVGYIAWSLLDNFEWADGYGKRFGLYRVDYYSQIRFPKFSARWFARLMASIRQPELVQGPAQKLKSLAPAAIKQWGIMKETAAPGVPDLEVMSAANIWQVKKRCLEVDCDGFEVKGGRAHLKPALSIMGGRGLGLHNYQHIPGSTSVFYLFSVPERPGQPDDIDIQVKAMDFDSAALAISSWHRSVGCVFMVAGMLTVGFGLAALLRRVRSVKNDRALENHLNAEEE